MEDITNSEEYIELKNELLGKLINLHEKLLRTFLSVSIKMKYNQYDMLSPIVVFEIYNDTNNIEIEQELLTFDLNDSRKKSEFFFKKGKEYGKLHKKVTSITILSEISYKYFSQEDILNDNDVAKEYFDTLKNKNLINETGEKCLASISIDYIGNCALSIYSIDKKEFNNIVSFNRTDEEVDSDLEHYGFDSMITFYDSIVQNMLEEKILNTNNSDVSELKKLLELLKININNEEDDNEDNKNNEFPTIVNLGKYGTINLN